MREDTRILVAAAQASTSVTPISAKSLGPKTKPIIRSTAKTPVLTTATACSSADTGVGAIIAAGSQPCNGITAAFTEPAKIISTKAACSTHFGAMSVVRKPPAVKLMVPLMQYTAITPAKKNWPEIRV